MDKKLLIHLLIFTSVIKLSQNKPTERFLQEAEDDTPSAENCDFGWCKLCYSDGVCSSCKYDKVLVDGDCVCPTGKVDNGNTFCDFETTNTSTGDTGNYGQARNQGEDQQEEEIVEEEKGAPVAAIVVPIVIVFILLFFGCCFIMKIKQKKEQEKMAIQRRQQEQRRQNSQEQKRQNSEQQNQNHTVIMMQPNQSNQMMQAQNVIQSQQQHYQMQEQARQQMQLQQSLQMAQQMNAQQQVQNQQYNYPANPMKSLDNPPDMRMDNKYSMDKRECEICFENPKNNAFYKCGHKACKECAESVKKSTGKCPFCREPILDIIKVFD